MVGKIKPQPHARECCVMNYTAGVNNTHIIYSTEVDTADLAVKQTGYDVSLGLKNELLPFVNVIGRIAGDLESWYEIQNATNGGDGTVSADSSTGGFTTELF